MRWFTFLCILLCISLFQSTQLHWITVGSAAPDLYFPLVVFYSFLTDLKRNTIANWLAGISKDLFSAGSFGINSIFFVAVGFLIWYLREIVFRGNVVTQVLITFIFSLIYNTLCAIHTALCFHSLNLSTTVFTILICSIYTAMIVPFLFWIFSKFQPTHGTFSIRGK